MTWQAWYALATVAGVLAALVRGWGSPDAVLLAGAVAVALAGIVTPAEAFSGFANEGLLTVAALFVVAAALRETGALDAIGSRMLGRAKTVNGALVRLSVSVTGLSAFLNNTPIVAMMLPVLTEWCRKHRVSPSRLLIPLSYFTILGGTCTLIGTSTNLVVSGFVAQEAKAEGGPRPGLHPFTLFEITPLGLLYALVGVSFILLVGRRLLPDRKDLIEQLSEHAREYLADLVVEPGCRLVGQTIEGAGLRHLPGLFLIEIERGDRVISPVGPEQVLRAGDRLTFTGVVSSIVDVQRIPGLAPPSDTGAARAERSDRRRLCEAVVSPTSPLIGKTIRGADFRAAYNAAVVAVHRGGARLEGRVGDIVLRSGDTLLLQTGPHFARAHRNNPDFILVSSVEGARPVRHHRSRVAIALLGLLLLLMSTGWVSVLLGAMLVAVLMVGLRCISTADARQSIDWQTLICIGASFGLGRALEKSGAVKFVAEALVANTHGLGPIAALAVFYLVTMVCTEMITNNAAAALMFPFAVAVAEQLGVSPRPFIVAVMFAASAAFATPIGYQTNMMVYGPGGYRFTDFTRIGLPLNLLLAVVATALIPIFWPFTR